MIWEVLGIDPTDDPDVIREAYRAKLIVTNPEDNPEGFMRLKEAYDEALKLLESGRIEGMTESQLSCEIFAHAPHWGNNDDRVDRLDKVGNFINDDYQEMK